MERGCGQDAYEGDRPECIHGVREKAAPQPYSHQRRGGGDIEDLLIASCLFPVVGVQEEVGW